MPVALVPESWLPDVIDISDGGRCSSGKGYWRTSLNRWGVCTRLHNSQLPHKDLLHITPTTRIHDHVEHEVHPLILIIILLKGNWNHIQGSVPHDGTHGIVLQPVEGVDIDHPQSNIECGLGRFLWGGELRADSGWKEHNIVTRYHVQWNLCRTFSTAQPVAKVHLTCHGIQGIMISMVDYNNHQVLSASMAGTTNTKANTSLRTNTNAT